MDGREKQGSDDNRKLNSGSTLRTEVREDLFHIGIWDHSHSDSSVAKGTFSQACSLGFNPWDQHSGRKEHISWGLFLDKTDSPYLSNS